MPIDPLQLLVIPLIIALVGILAAAWVYDLKTLRHKKSKNETVYRCAACRRIYTEMHRTPLAHCPQCGKQNAPVRQ